ncbi:unnamed protein product [Vicia faba]|uniref:Uncharacterized protein n=1 Tax=Vicia faba TaxID=3906 RepID=A0AAV0YTA3_VICFA|nr:unnamed protein product [Vicia faba]
MDFCFYLYFVSHCQYALTLRSRKESLAQRFVMDFDDIEAPIKATSRVSRFAPKASKLKPKTEQILLPKSEPPSFPSAKVKPPEIDLTAKPNGITSTNGIVKIDESEAKLDSMDVDMTEAEVQEDSTHANPMEEDEEEDIVVRKIDVYFSPSINGGTKSQTLSKPLDSSPSQLNLGVV